MVEKPPYVEVIDAVFASVRSAVARMDVMARRALAQAHKHQPVGIWPPLLMSLKKTCEVCKGQSRKPSKVVLRDFLKRAVLRVAHWPISTGRLRQVRTTFVHRFTARAGHHIEGGSLADIFVGRNATKRMRLRGGALRRDFKPRTP
jgi:hypothetical protein